MLPAPRWVLWDLLISHINLIKQSSSGYSPPPIIHTCERAVLYPRVKNVTAGYSWNAFFLLENHVKL